MATSANQFLANQQLLQKPPFWTYAVSAVAGCISILLANSFSYWPEGMAGMVISGFVFGTTFVLVHALILKLKTVLRPPDV